MPRATAATLRSTPVTWVCLLAVGLCAGGALAQDPPALREPHTLRVALPGAMPEQVPGTVVQSPPPTDSEALQAALAADGANKMRDATSALTRDLGVMAGVQVQGSRLADLCDATGVSGGMDPSIRGAEGPLSPAFGLP